MLTSVGSSSMRRPGGCRHTRSIYGRRRRCDGYRCGINSCEERNRRNDTVTACAP